uniref:Uncharacterized protein n=1 Tax=Homalodisca liturata TaxID=320908 RepID=A0A1B6IJN0_9HEMI
MFTSAIIFGLAIITCSHGKTVDKTLVEDLSASISASINKDLESGGDAALGGKSTLKEAVKNVRPQLEHLADLTSPQEATDMVIGRFALSADSGDLATRMGSNRRRHLAALMKNAVMGAQRFRY